MRKKKTLNDFYTDLVEHQQADKVQFELIHAKLDKMPTKDEIKDVSKQAMVEVLFSTGRITKTTILTGAAIVIALGVISGAWKGVLAWLTFSKM